jgi:FtsX-like permease family protein
VSVELPGAPPRPRPGRRFPAATGLSLRLLRLGGRRAWTAAALMAAGIAMGTLLLTVAFGALHGWDAREARTGWRPAGFGDPTAPSSATVALVRSTPDQVVGRPLQVVDVLATRPDSGAPPGLPRMPAPGELWVSPALADLLATLPADRLADRFGGAPAGTIGPDGLRDPGELVAVRGASGDLPGAVAVSTFAASPLQLDEIEVYRQLTWVAVVLMGVPAVGLLGAAARLSAARRVQRLATLRLLGASTGQVTAVAVTEVAAVAVVAAVVGVLAEWLIAPALAAIELGGSAWGAGDLRPGPGVLALVVLGVAVLATLAAVGGTRQVVVGPLGVARRDRPGQARLIRLVGLVAGIGVFAAANSLARTGAPEVGGLVFGFGILVLFGTVSLVGPLVVRLVGGRMVRAARTPASLLAGRRLLDDPRGAFRPLAGLVLAVFVAGFLAPLTAAIAGADVDDDTTLWMRVGDASPAATAAVVSGRLAELDIPAEVTTGERTVGVVPGPGVDRDRVRTALVPVAGGAPVLTDKEDQAVGSVITGDLVRGVLVVLAGTFLLAATSAGTTAAARVLDQGPTLRRLRLAGTPLAVLDAARRAETLRPLLANAGIALALGLVCAAPFAAATRALEPGGLVLLGSVLAGGLALVLAASAASRPLLRAVTTARGGEE